MVLDTSLLNTQQYKVRMKGKVEQPRGKSGALHLGVVAMEKGAFGLPLTTVTNFTFTIPRLMDLSIGAGEYSDYISVEG